MKPKLTDHDQVTEHIKNLQPSLAKVVETLLRMKQTILVILVAASIASCTNPKDDYNIRNENFNRELIQLREYFHIPGLAVIVKKGEQTLYESYMGFADLRKKVAIDSNTVFPMASLTKMFTGVLVMQLVEDGKLSLDESINNYVTHENIPDSIKIKHVLSHTSQGRVGQNFYYSSRFGWLTTVVEEAGGAPFEMIIQEKIIKSIGLTNSFLLKDSAQIFNEGRKIALPYFYEGETTDGFIDYGYSAAAGITSTVRDLTIFSKALDDNSLINEESRIKMFTPPKTTLPYGYGIFVQTFRDKKLIWGYGQYDCYSSLFLKIPNEDLTLVLAANNNLMSDPARLIYGDVTNSLFALSFLNNYVFELNDIPLLEDTLSLTTLANRLTNHNSEFYLKKLIAQAVADSFLAMYEPDKSEQSKAILRQIFKRFPRYETYGDLTLLHNLSFLKAIAEHREQKDFTGFDKELKRIGLHLADIDANNPYTNYYLANYYLQKDVDSTLFFYNRIIHAPNFSKNWYTSEAENWVNGQEGRIKK